MTLDRIKSAVNFLDANKGKLLDVGVGYGFFEILVSKKKPNISLYGIDISGKGLKKLLI
jgi:tRNA G46 methylase TrmB